jgi:hypothetical protein
MIDRRYWPTATLVSLALTVPGEAAHAVTPLTQATGSATLVRPVTVVKTKDMDFGALSVTTAGTAVLEPNADTISATGGVILSGGTPHSAEFLGSAGQTSQVVNIKVPNQPSTLTRVGGTETMTVSNFTLQGQSKRALAAATSFSFRVGGTLNVGANQAEGTYVGTFTVTVQYP